MIFWGAVGGFSGYAYGALMGGVGGLIVGSGLAIVVNTKAVFVSTIVQGNRLSAADACAILENGSEWACDGLRYGSVSVGGLFAVSYGIYLAYLMKDTD